MEGDGKRMHAAPATDRKRVVSGDARDRTKSKSKALLSRAFGFDRPERLPVATGKSEANAMTQLSSGTDPLPLSRKLQGKNEEDTDSDSDSSTVEVGGLDLLNFYVR